MAVGCGLNLQARNSYVQGLSEPGGGRAMAIDRRNSLACEMTDNLLAEVEAVYPMAYV